MAEQKIKYNFGSMRKVGETSIGYIEGWTFQPQNRELLNVRTVNVKGQEKKVATLTISTNLAKSVMKYNFGEDFNTEHHYIECTAWGQVAERLEKYAPVPKLLLGFFGEIKVQEYDKKDGSKGKRLVMTIDDFKPRTSKPQSAEPTPQEVLTPVQDMAIPF